MDQYCVTGNPVAHSRSPWIHARFAELTGQAMHYGRRELPLDGFAAGVAAFRAQPGARGCNVTVPFKFEAFALATRRTPRAELAQAVNTLAFRGDDVLGDNTDGIGLVRDITVHAGVPLAGRALLLLGAGGGAAGVLGPLIEAGCARIVVANRTPDKALALVQRHGALARRHGTALQAHALPAVPCPPSGFDVLINGTASSLAGEAVPVAPEVLAPGALAVDMMYGPAAAGFLAWARAHGAVPRDGLGMLVAQAAESFSLWRDVRPPTGQVLAELRALIGP